MLKGVAATLLICATAGLCPLAHAKGSPQLIVVSGGGLSHEVDIRDPGLLKPFDPWTGQLFDSKLPTVAEPACARTAYEVEFFMKWATRHSAVDRGNLSMIYQLRYCHDESGGYIYLPGPNDTYYEGNRATIVRDGRDGRWSRSTTAWDAFIRSSVDRAASAATALHDCLWLRHDRDGREFGRDAIDPLLWDRTAHLIAGSSNREALQCIETFVRDHGKLSLRAPMERSLFQRDMWAIYDWASWDSARSRQRRNLMARLARVIRAVAPTADEAGTLPDPYAVTVNAHRFAEQYARAAPERPFLPPDLFDPHGSWVCLSGFNNEPAVPGHFTGRSVFLAFLRLPAGREATLDYIARLRAFHEPPLVAGQSFQELNLRLPQFPAGTEVALVRRLLVIDATGHIVPTPITESIQLRVYHAVTPGSPYMNFMGDKSVHDQDFYEFRFSPAALLAGQPSLVPVARDEAEFATFATQGQDPFEQPSKWLAPGPTLNRCVPCHTASGIHSVESRTRWINANAAPDYDLDKVIAWETKVTIAQKEKQKEFQEIVKEVRTKK